MAIELTSGVTVLNPDLSKTIEVGAGGLSPEDIERFRKYFAQMQVGEIDTITLIPQEDIDVSDDLNLVVYAQLDKVIGEYAQAQQIRASLNAPGANYTGLHFDSGREAKSDGELEGKRITQSGVRINFNTGVYESKTSNIPSHVEEKDFQPFFIFGRDSAVNGSSESIRSFSDFVPSVTVDLSKPVWNIFRNLGDPHGSNPPVTHCVIPRQLAEKVLDPEATFEPLFDVEIGEAYPGGPIKTKKNQAVIVDGERTEIGTLNDTPYKDANGIGIGFDRTIKAVDYVPEGLDISDM